MKCSLGSSNFLEEISAAAKLLQLCPTLCDPVDGSPPGSSIPGILQARTLEWVAISSSNAWKWKVKVKSLSPLRDPMDCGLPGSSVHGILEWVAIAFSEEIAGLSHSIVFLYFFTLIPEEGFLISLCYSLELCIQMGLSFLFSFAFSFSLWAYTEKAMALHSSTLAWKIPWTEEPGRLQSMGSRRVGHDWATSLWAYKCSEIIPALD